MEVFIIEFNPLTLLERNHYSSINYVLHHCKKDEINALGQQFLSKVATQVYYVCFNLALLFTVFISPANVLFLQIWINHFWKIKCAIKRSLSRFKVLEPSRENVPNVLQIIQ